VRAEGRTADPVGHAIRKSVVQMDLLNAVIATPMGRGRSPVDCIRLLFAYTGIYVSRTSTRPKHGHPLQEVR
jgi:hypothetical protein